MNSKVFDEVSIADLFDQFIEASTMKGVLSLHHRILNYSDLEPCEFNIFYPKFKKTVADSRQRKNWRAKAIFSKIDKKANHRCYSNTKLVASQPVDHNNSRDNSNDNNALHLASILSNDALQHHSCLIIGGGPAGLRTAIELQLLGAKRVLVAEKRSRFSRNNVVHLWPFVIDDLKSLGAKKFYGKFCAGSIDHISIRQLQLTLLKICLIIGCDFRDSCSYISNCPASIKSTNDVSNSQLSLDGTLDGDIIANVDEENDRDKTERLKSEEIICDLDIIDQKHGHNSTDFVKVSEFIIPNAATSEPLIAKSTIEPGQILESDTNHQNDTRNENASIDEKTPPNQKNVDNGISRSSPNINHLVNSHCETLVNGHREERIRHNHNHSMKPNLRGTKVHFECDAKHIERELHAQEWDVIIGADGHRNTLKKYFPRKEFRGKLAIAITANFINRQTPTEAAVPEISGISFIYNQDMFNALSYDTNIDLENICYYKDDTHYFVMTAKKKSLIERGVLLSDYATTQQLLADSNVNREALLKFAKDAAFWTTGLEPLDFALNHYGQEDCAMFDFTSMYAAINACKAVRTKAGGLALFGLVGDSLLEPFWPTGSGCARGFLSSFDAAWMCRQWAVNKCASLDHHDHQKYGSSSKSSSRNKHNKSNSAHEMTTNNKMVLSVMAERESIYRVLAQTTSENLQQNYSHWTLNPHTRYPNLNRHLVLPSQVEHLVIDNSVRPSNLTPRIDSRGSKKVKSPLLSATNNPSSRKSPKKLKSSIDISKGEYRSRSSLSNPKSKNAKSELAGDTYWEFEESYKNLSDDKNGPKQYLNHLNFVKSTSQREYSIYATTNRRSQQLSSNIYDDEMARRARDIDDCIRLRRQRNQLSVVRDQILEKFCGKGIENGKAKSGDIKSQLSTESATLFNELKRLRDQRLAASTGGKWKDADGSSEEPMSPLFLLNSIRRCASFAERVKNFEGKLDVQSGAKNSRQNGSTSPRTAPIDNVKNLPQFATLQRLLTNRHRSSDSVSSDYDQPQHRGASFFDQAPKKSKIPIMKLTKDDWNVKCWEERLAAYEKRDIASKENSNLNFIGRHNTSQLSKSKSVDSGPKRNVKAPKQIEVFKDRIKEMANKLELKPDDELTNATKHRNNSRQVRRSMTTINGQGQQILPLSSTSSNMNINNNLNPTSRQQQQAQPKGWVTHLRQELIKSSQQSSINSQLRRTNQSGRPVKKLFDDTDDDADRNNKSAEIGFDPNKHYDHLCINRPKNKYLSRNNYKSHLNRVRYDKDTSIVINRQVSNEEKRLFMSNLESRTSSVNSSDACSDLSTIANIQGSGTPHNKPTSTTLGLSPQNNENGRLCPRCRNKVTYQDGITVNDNLLHRSCLVCANCSITLRTTEIQYHLNSLKDNRGAIDDSEPDTTELPDFLCAICKPSIRNDLCRVVVDRLAKAKNPTNSNLDNHSPKDAYSTMTSASSSVQHGKHEAKQTVVDEARPAPSTRSRRDDFLSQRINYNELYKNIVEDATKNNKIDNKKSHHTASTGSTIDNLDASLKRDTSKPSGTCQARREAFKIAKSESVDGSEVVTLELPIEDGYEMQNNSSSSQASRNVGPRGVMVDEEEIHRILHLDLRKNQSNDDEDDDDNESESTSSSTASDEVERDRAKDRDKKQESSTDLSGDDVERNDNRPSKQRNDSDAFDDSSSLNSALDTSLESENDSNDVELNISEPDSISLNSEFDQVANNEIHENNETRAIERQQVDKVVCQSP